MTLSWSGDSQRIVVGGGDGSGAVYTRADLDVVAAFPADGSEVFAAALMDAGRTVVTAQSDGRISRRSVLGDTALVSVAPSRTPVSAVAVGPPGSIVAGGLYSGAVAVVDQTSMRLVRTLQLGPYEHPDTTLEPARHLRVTAVGVSPDGASVVAGDRSGHLRMWSVATGVAQWSTTSEPVEQLAVSPDGRWLATVEARPATGTLEPDWLPERTWFRLWDLHSGRQVWSTPVGDPAHPPGSYDGAPKPKMLHFSPDSSMVVVPYLDSNVEVYATDRPRRLAEITSDELGDGVHAMAAQFTPDSATILVRLASDSTMLPFDPRTGKRDGPAYPGRPGGSYGTMGFSSDGGWLFSRTTDGLSAYDTRTRQLLLDRVSFLAGGGDVRFDGGEGSMAIAGGSLFASTPVGIARLDIDPEHWTAVACRLAGRTLSEDEWARVLPARPYAPACATS